MSGDPSSAQRTFRFGLEPFSDALGVVVMLDVAGQRGYFLILAKLDTADYTLVIRLEFLRVVEPFG
jgi:hypothetical protein